MFYRLSYAGCGYRAIVDVVLISRLARGDLPRVFRPMRCVVRLLAFVHVHVLCVAGWGHAVAPAHRSGGHNPVPEQDFFTVLGQVA